MRLARRSGKKAPKETTGKKGREKKPRTKKRGKKAREKKRKKKAREMVREKTNWLYCVWFKFYIWLGEKVVWDF